LKTVWAARLLLFVQWKQEAIQKFFKKGKDLMLLEIGQSIEL
jgi:hypothetical protein